MLDAIIYDNISKYILDKYSNCGKYMSEKVPDAIFFWGQDHCSPETFLGRRVLARSQIYQNPTLPRVISSNNGWSSNPEWLSFDAEMEVYFLKFTWS